MPKSPLEQGIDWWQAQPSWVEKAQTQLGKDHEAFRRGGAREMMKDIDLSIDLAPHFGSGMHSDLGADDGNGKYESYSQDPLSVLKRDHG